jgi:hypothetical protein
MCEYLYMYDQCGIIYFLSALFIHKKINSVIIEKRLWSDYFAKANPQPSLAGANPLLAITGTLGCWVSPLAHCVPP